MRSFEPEAGRRSIRLKGYDYAQPGAYFITICARGRECLFGEVVDGEMRLNRFGEIVREEWLKTAVMRPGIEIDEFAVMPNHIHGIVIIHEKCRARCIVPLPRTNTPPRNDSGNQHQTRCPP